MNWKRYGRKQLSPNLRDNRNGQTKNMKINFIHLWHLPGGSEENHGKYHMTAMLLAEILNLNLTNMKHECVATQL
jgi:hypothetical protein